MQGKILVVDDDEAILESIMIVLQEEGYTVTTTTDPFSVDEIEKIAPDLIILDIFLSGKDGRDTARQLKEDKRTRHIPIIMISALPSAEKSAQESGAAVFLPKPFDIYNLLDLVRTQLA